MIQGLKKVLSDHTGQADFLLRKYSNFYEGTGKSSSNKINYKKSKKWPWQATCQWELLAQRTSWNSSYCDDGDDNDN